MNDKAKKGILQMLDDETLEMMDGVFSSMIDNLQDVTANQISELAVPLRNILGLCERECRDDCQFNEMYLNTGYKLCEIFIDVADCLDSRVIKDQREKEQAATESQGEEKTVLRIHDVKSWPQYFQPVLLGKKVWEYRINDRDYHVGDLILMKEWVPEEDLSPITNRNYFTGKWVLADITSVHGGLPGMKEGYCILNIFVREVGTNITEIGQALDNVGDYEVVPVPPEK